MKWYLTLNLNQRINLKELYIKITGVPFDLAISLYGFIEAMNIVHTKLVLEGFDV